MSRIEDMKVRVEVIKREYDKLMQEIEEHEANERRYEDMLHKLMENQEIFFDLLRDVYNRKIDLDVPVFFNDRTLNEVFKGLSVTDVMRSIAWSTPKYCTVFYVTNTSRTGRNVLIHGMPAYDWNTEARYQAANKLAHYLVDNNIAV